MGKALLAFSPPALVDMFLGRGLTAYTPFTLTAPDRFRRALAMTRLSRLAVARWELEPDRSALAVPVFGPGGRVAAAIEVRVDDPTVEIPTVRPALVIAGRSLTRELSAGPDLAARGGLRPQAARPGHAGAASTVRKLHHTGNTVRKVMGDG
jgi:DNA-binding IclR family transcriptional regulator